MRRSRLSTIVLALCVVSGAAAASACAEPEPGSAGWIYDPSKVVIVDLTLSPSAEAELKAEPDEYVEGGFAISTIDGAPGGEEHLVESRGLVGIRLKGSAQGSFRPLSGKAAFKVKFNFENEKGEKGKKYLGLKKLTLNNMVEDFSLVHETLAYTAYRGVGLPASRTGYAFVRVNGNPYGLYLDIEDMDDVALERWFGKFEDPQHLYEGESGADVIPGADALPPGEGGFEVDEGDEANLDDLKALVAAVNSTEGEGWSAAVAPVANLAEMTRIWAVEKYIGHWDGYAGQAGKFQPNNYFLYSDASGVFQMLPWGSDETFERHLAFDGPAGRMFNRCLADPACLALYRQELTAVGKTVASLGLDKLASDTATSIKPWEEADPRLEHPELVDGAVAKTRDFLAERPAELSAFLGPEGSPPVAAGGEVPHASAPSLEVGRSRRHAAVLVTHLWLAGPGVLSQAAKIGTAHDSHRACSTQVSVPTAGPRDLRCPLSAAILRRLRAHGLTLQVRTSFAPQDGSPESTFRRIHLARFPG
jgi:spore coat protein CotH